MNTSQYFCCMIVIPKINPIRFSYTGVDTPAVNHQFYARYFQKYRRTDSTSVQILVPTGEGVQDWVMSAERIDGSRYIEYSVSIATNTYSNLISGHKVVEFGIDFVNFEEGLYRFTLSGGATRYYSGPICVKDVHKFTSLISYRNTYNVQDMAFSTGTTFNIRVEVQDGGIVPKSNDAVYSDDIGGFQILSSDPFSNLRINIGGTKGIPGYLMKIVNRVFSCDTTYIDGVRVVKTDGSTFEEVSQENYSLRSWNIEVSKGDDVSDEHVITLDGVVERLLDNAFSSSTHELKLFSTGNWRVVGGYPDWVTVTPVSGVSFRQDISVSVLQNEDLTARRAVIRFQLLDIPSAVALLEINQADEVLYLLSSEANRVIITEQEDFVIDLKI